jgi:type IV pilus assembly protein PilQ
MQESIRMRGCFAFLGMSLVFALPARADVAGPHAAEAPTSEPTVARVRVAGRADRADVEILGSFTVPTYSVHTLDDGRVVIVEVPGARLAPDGFAVEGSALLVGRASASTTAHGVRVELRLTRAGTYRARASQGRIRLVIDREATEAASEDADAPGGFAAGPVEILGVVIERRNDRERVVTELSRPAPFRVIPGQTGPAKLEIEGARVGSNVAERIEGDSRSVVHSVRVRETSGRAVVEVERAAGSGGTAIREGNRIVWLFAGPAEDAPNRARVVAKQDAVEIDGQEVAAFLSDVPLQIGPASGETRRYTGRRIDLDFKDADIHNILRLLSEVGNVNIVSADDVAGSVTIKMRSVPWDQALDVILSAKGLGMVRRENLLRVAPQAVLEKEREMAIARKKQKMELAPLETRLLPVSYATAVEISARVQDLLSERGSVSVDNRTNVLVVRDVTESLDDVEDLIRQLDTQTPQVLIEGRVVEATTSFTHEFGIQWGGSYVASSATGNPTGLVFPHDFTVAGGASDGETPTSGLSPFGGTVPNPNFVVNFPAPAGTGQGTAIGVTMGSLSGNFNLAVRLTAFETTGNVRIISAPRILTLDNQAATISQGTSIPYSQVSAQGVQTAFQEATISLTVTPHVTNDGGVAMDVAITRNEPDFNQTSARGDPTILKRQANTKLMVQDGHTAVIGGIYTRNSGQGIDKIPFFGDLPILGVLFSHSQQRDGRTEMLMFLTPRIVNRSEALGR